MGLPLSFKEVTLFQLSMVTDVMKSQGRGTRRRKTVETRVCLDADGWQTVDP